MKYSTPIARAVFSSRSASSREQMYGGGEIHRGAPDPEEQ
jgi:hypothetical protein